MINRDIDSLLRFYAGGVATPKTPEEHIADAEVLAAEVLRLRAMNFQEIEDLFNAIPPKSETAYDSLSRVEE